MSLSTDSTAPAGPTATAIKSIPNTSSKPNTFSGARFAALTNPIKAITAANGVAKPIVSNTAARSVPTATSRIAGADEQAK